MSALTETQEQIFNDGERLIPGLTHDIIELIRHRTTYVFFKRIIEQDLASGIVRGPIRILDLGCGVGHGCKELAGIADARITGVDIMPEALEYARANYGTSNVEYLQSSIEDYVENMDSFDYIVSRHALEHVEDGLSLCSRLKWSQRLMVDVPYKEPAGVNPHHLVSEIEDESFPAHPTAEFFYQDMQGAIHQSPHGVADINTITYAISQAALPAPSTLLPLPFPRWEPPYFILYKALDFALRKVMKFLDSAMKSYTRMCR